MKYILTIFLLLTWITPAQAQMDVTFNLCLEPDEPEIGADYVPGVDVNGKPVTSADLETGIEGVAYPIKVPIELDILHLLNQGLEQDIKMDADVAEISIFKDGHVEYNGQDITNNVNFGCEGQIDVLVEDNEDYEPPETVEATEDETSEKQDVAPDGPSHGQEPQNPVPSSEPEGVILEGEAQ